MKRPFRKPGCKGWGAFRDRGAFTLLELLVVIAILGVLASVLLPALGKARSKSRSVLCWNNERQLSLALLLYTGSHEETLPYNLGVEGTRKTVAEESFLNWVNNVMTWDLESENTNSVLAVTGGLGPYLSGSAGAYLCPEDRAVSGIQREAGWTRRVRSYSMNAMVGDAGAFTMEGVNVNNPYYRQFFRLTDIPEPSGIFVFIDEHPDSINDAYFLNKPSAGEWHDLPASYHDGGATLAFADGHVEGRRWHASSTQLPPRPDVAPLPFAVPAEGRVDFDWLMERTSLKNGYGH